MAKAQKYRLPRSVQMAGRKIRIRYVDDLGENWGEFDENDCSITIENTCLQSRAFFRKILRHELLHAVLHLSGLSFTESFQEEALIRCMDALFFPGWDIIDQKYFSDVDVSRPPVTPSTDRYKKDPALGYR